VQIAVAQSQALVRATSVRVMIRIVRARRFSHSIRTCDRPRIHTVDASAYSADPIACSTISTIEQWQMAEVALLILIKGQQLSGN
jgi:hypothetical protein